MASWLMRSTPERAVRVRALGPVSRKTRSVNGPGILFSNRSLKKSRVCSDL